MLSSFYMDNTAPSDLQLPLGNVAPAMFTSYYYQKQKGKHCGAENSIVVLGL